MEKVDRCKCLTCKYGYTTNGYTVYCDYLGMTGKRRNCPYGMCDKYKDGKQKRIRTLKGVKNYKCNDYRFEFDDASSYEERVGEFGTTFIRNFLHMPRCNSDDFGEIREE